MPADRHYTRFYELVNLERGLIVAGLALLVGLALLLAAVNQWRLAGFGRLDYAHTMRLVVPGVTLTALGFQTSLELLRLYLEDAKAMSEDVALSR